MHEFSDEYRLATVSSAAIIRDPQIIFGPAPQEERIPGFGKRLDMSLCLEVPPPDLEALERLHFVYPDAPPVEHTVNVVAVADKGQTRMVTLVSYYSTVPSAQFYDICTHFEYCTTALFSTLR